MIKFKRSEVVLLLVMDMSARWIDEYQNIDEIVRVTPNLGSSAKANKFFIQEVLPEVSSIINTPKKRKSFVRKAESVIESANMFGLKPHFKFITREEVKKTKKGKVKKSKTKVYVDIPTVYGLITIDLGEYSSSPRTLIGKLMLAETPGSKLEPSDWLIEFREEFTRKPVKRIRRRIDYSFTIIKP